VIAAVSTVIPAPVESVWPLLADFTAWHSWLPGIVATTMEGDDLRILHREDGSTIRERLLLKDSVRRTMAYTFDGDHPFPVRRYVGTVRVEPVTTDDSTYLHWCADFDAEAVAEQAAAATFTRIYQSFFRALSTVAAGRAPESRSDLSRTSAGRA
jgi:carbon monoxide dehydrogenase subunit G